MVRITSSGDLAGKYVPRTSTDELEAYANTIAIVDSRSLRCNPALHVLRHQSSVWCFREHIVVLPNYITYFINAFLTLAKPERAIETHAV